ncbi:uncharacterized protein BP5553_01478 [Venustampulla echinocandica]|uniref:SCP domain-containing protein n=1 Tax=Venustampulla echinocandica TaxID=2656787 RepID=A0A370U145_9HELO|nr:uncharacterized protein BP5553_01478 [Venustampulla echinocandica]RDL41499.1 hypothetical protein BP5553_01478 [Venustampulla echinocandica]
MRSSIPIASLFAALAIAKPLNHMHHKKAYVTEMDVVVETKYVTITEGAPLPTPLEANVAAVTTVLVQNTVYDAPVKASPAPVKVVPSAPAAVFVQKEQPAPTPSKAAAPVVVAAPAPVAPVVSAPAADTNGLTPFQLASINAHGVHRGNHSVGGLSWNATLATSAAANAAKCVFAHDDCGSGGCGFGQNLNIWGQAPFPSSIDINSVVANAITEGWYNGELPTFSKYGDSNPVTPTAPGAVHPADPWLHFTQVIWKDTVSVGCAVQRCDAGTANTYESVYTVCNYFPPGNYKGSFDKNVFVPKGEATVKASIIKS